MSRIVLVTGGIGGIGTAICMSLAKQGSTVIANHHPSESEDAAKWKDALSAEGLKVDTISADVSSFDESARMVNEIVTKYGPVDVLVNCAGITRDKTFKRMAPEHWSSVISVNLDSVFNVTRNVWESMLDRKFGRIINISSVNGQRGQFGQTNYSASKAGMHGFTMALAQEGASKGITVNTVSPGYVESAMTRAMDESIRDGIVKTIPVGRIGKPEDIAAAVAFLAGEEAGYITGANLPVNGGLFIH